MCKDIKGFVGVVVIIAKYFKELKCLSIEDRLNDVKSIQENTIKLLKDAEVDASSHDHIKSTTKLQNGHHWELSKV